MVRQYGAEIHKAPYEQFLAVPRTRAMAFLQQAQLYTVITVAPVVLRASRSRWARAASRNGYVCQIATFTLPASTIPNSSLADARRSSRLAV